MDTNKGYNWIVVVFYCEKSRWPSILVALFDHVKRNPEWKIPHFTIRRDDPRYPHQLFVSLRIFRDASVRTTAMKEEKSYLMNMMQALGIPVSDYKIDPRSDPKGDLFESRHSWIPKDAENDYWTDDRCRVLHNLSNLAKNIAKYEKDDRHTRLNFAHLSYNMLGIDERLIPRRPPPPRFYY